VEGRGRRRGRSLLRNLAWDSLRGRVLIKYVEGGPAAEGRGLQTRVKKPGGGMGKRSQPDTVKLSLNKARPKG